MTLKSKFSPKLLLVLNAAGMALAAAIVILLLRVDGLVHGTLYSYGLRFDDEWAIPYWTFLRLVLGFLCGIVGVNAFSIAYVALSRKGLQRQLSTAVSSRPAAQTLRVEIEREKERPEKEHPEKERLEREMKSNGVEITALPMVCNKCGKVFTQPLSMFDFRSGKPRLVNVCPYCNALLSVSGDPQSQ